MTAPLLYTLPNLNIIDRPADSQHCGGTRKGFRFIWIHDTDTPSDGHGLDSLDYLTVTPNSRVSATRYIPEAGPIYKLMDDAVVPWTNGATVLEPVPMNAPGVNEWSLTIECERGHNNKGPWPFVQVQLCAWQCAEWHGKYGEIPILGHGWAQANKTDPRLFPWDIFYIELDKRKRQGVRVYT